MQKWEYVTLDIKYGVLTKITAINGVPYAYDAQPLFHRALKDYGGQGWEAVGITNAESVGSPSCDFIVLLKRPVP